MLGSALQRQCPCHSRFDEREQHHAVNCGMRPANVGSTALPSAAMQAHCHPALRPCCTSGSPIRPMPQRFSQKCETGPQRRPEWRISPQAVRVSDRRKPACVGLHSLWDHFRKFLRDHANAAQPSVNAGDRAFTLRQLAMRCGVTPAYLSRVERDEVAPPGEDTLLKLADELGEDADVLLAMAGKISADLRQAIISRPKLFADLIRSIKSMPDQAVLKIVRDVRDGQW